MTDYNELVNQLREYLTTRQISELLEAQAKEIAELKEMMRALIIIVEFSNMADSSRELTSHARAALKGEK